MNTWAQQIEEDLSWREAEIAALKLQVANAGVGSTRYIALLRALWCILYAHYEGFTKFCWDLFLDTVENEKVQRSDLVKPLIDLSLEKEFKTLRGDLSTTKLVSYMQSDFPVQMSSMAIFEIKLCTESNLWPNVFKNNCMKINISCPTLDENNSKLRTLVYRRNEIAHGKKMIIKTLAEYQPYEDATILLMDELAITIVDCLDKKSYRIIK